MQIKPSLSTSNQIEQEKQLQETTDEQKKIHTEGLKKFTWTRLLSSALFSAEILSAVRVVKKILKTAVLLLFKEKSYSKSFNRKLRDVRTLHAAAGIATAYAKHVMKNDTLLVSTRNVGQLETLNNQDDLEQARLIGKKLKEATPEEFLVLTGKEKKLCSPRMLDRIANEEYSTTLSEGVCLATTFDFAQRFIAGGRKIADLVNIAKIYQEGVPAEVTGHHAVYSGALEVQAHEDNVINLFHIIIGKYPNLDDQNIAKGIQTIIENAKNILSNLQKNQITRQIDDLAQKLPQITDEKIKKQIQGHIRKLTQRLDNIKLPTEDPFRLLDLCLRNTQDAENLLENVPIEIKSQMKEFLDKYKDLPITEKNLLEKDVENDQSAYMLGHLMGAKIDNAGTHEARRMIGPYTGYASSIDHLANFDSLSDGVYRPTFSAGTEQHTILYIKQDGQGFFFDPYIGLIECNGNHTNTFLKLLSMYPPPQVPKEQRLDNEDEDFPNYRVSLNKIASEDKIASQV